MENSNQLQTPASHAVRNKVRSFRHHQLTRSNYPSRCPHRWLRLEQIDRLKNARRDESSILFKFLLHVSFQTGRVPNGSALAQPLVVMLVNAAGVSRANKTVVSKSCKIMAA